MRETQPEGSDESDEVADADSVLKKLKKVWAQGLTAPSPEDEGPLWVDPDMPVWGNIDPDEVS
ncbi:MAG: hypothetical protein VKP62_11675 [Candidatus Sericytochromatia bacterium]|nr:hypothetical protein [Candidatus Sericytochromatia bacterium]